MADYLAINWEKTGISGVEAHVSGSAVTVKHSFRIDWPEQLNPTKDPISAGSWLKNELGRLRIASKSVLISFPRHESTIRLLEIPDVPLEEIPEIVRFQAATRSSVPLGQLLLDFLLLPAQAGKATRDVLVASIVKDLHDQAVKTFQSMGMDVVSTGISAISSAEWIAHATTGNMDAPILIVNQVDHYLEMSLISNRQILFTNSASMTSTDRSATEQAMITEINRFLLARSAQLAGQKTERVILVGEPQSQQEIAAKLGERFQCVVEVLDPLMDVMSDSGTIAALEYPGVLAGPMGLLYAQTHKKLEAIDFLHPHKTEAKPDRRKMQIGLGVAGAILILLAALYMTKSSIADLEDQIAAQQKIQRDLDELLKRGQPTLESVALIQEWETSNSKVLKVLQELESVLPGTDRLVLSEMAVTRSAGQSLSRLRASGHAKDDLEVRDLNQQLSNKNYRVHPRKSNSVTGDAAYPVPFELDAERLPPKVEPPPKAVPVKE